jgi:tRNA(adenine34) deaminase
LPSEGGRLLDFISPDIAAMSLEAFMGEALLEAESAGRAGELPIGAVLVVDGEIVSRGRARHKEARSQLRHAELNALLSGGEALWRGYRRAVLFTTVEPCPMCLGAVVMADVPHVIFALHDQLMGSKETLESNPYVRRHIKSYHGGVLAQNSEALFAKYAPEGLRHILRGGTV